ncbi:MAG TPA: hypothetical protein VI643_06670 [Planctomycetota bacterium]|nr:hypothetical protein [Planctomycetota bacterium]
MWTVFDSVALPGEPVAVLARFERRLFGVLRWFSAGVDARFEVEGRRIETRTEGGGYAQAFLPSLPTKGMRAVSLEPTSAGQGAAWVEPADRPLLITDLDQTISQPSAFSFWWRPLNSIEPFPGALETLRKAAETRLIVYLTARIDLVLGKTRAWLKQRGFPDGPVFCRHRRSPGATSEAFKRETVALLKNRWPRISFGIGDKELDVRAYTANQVPAIRFAPSPASAPPSIDGVRTCASWAEIDEIVNR